MKTKCLTLLLGCLAGAAAEAADVSIMVHQDDRFMAAATVGRCSGGCTNQMAITTKYQFQFNGNYAALINELNSLELRASVLDSSWQDAESGELVMKVSSTVHQRQIWRRSVLARRKAENPTALANSIYNAAVPGEVVTLEFNQQPTPINSSDFTINVRLYQSDVLLTSGSEAVIPRMLNNEGSEEVAY